MINFGKTLREPNPKQALDFKSQTKLFQKNFVTREEEQKAYEKYSQRLLVLDTKQEDLKIKVIENEDYNVEDAF